MCKGDLTGSTWGENCLKAVGFSVVESEDKEEIYFLEEPDLDLLDEWYGWFQDLKCKLKIVSELEIM